MIDDQHTNQPQQDASPFKKTMDQVWEWAQVASAFLLGAIVLLLLGGVIWVLFRPAGTVLEGLPDAAYARGVITFIIALATIAIALILTITSVQRGQNVTDDERKAAQARFERGKQVLTVLVGILGTIVGFYFGSDDDRPGVRVLEPRSQPAELVEGQPATLSSAVSGGSAPYAYTIEFDGLEIEDREGETPDGWISETFTLPAVDGDTEFRVKILVEDGDGRSAQAERGWTLGDSPAAQEP